MKIRKVFCANEQEITDHVITFVNGEYILTCECKRFIKLPGNLSKDEIDAALDAHEIGNKDQVTQAALDKEAEEKLKLI